NLLDLLAGNDATVSEMVSELPTPQTVYRSVACPWSLKGAVMRVLAERMKDREVDLLDGIKVLDNGGWAQAIPDPYEPVVHLYAEGATHDEALALEATLGTVVEEVVSAGLEAGETQAPPV
ncbi:MAG: hypothetical protein ACE5EV_06245, partial [Gaiellales bacterium]